MGGLLKYEDSDELVRPASMHGNLLIVFFLLSSGIVIAILSLILETVLCRTLKKA